MLIMIIVTNSLVCGLVRIQDKMNRAIYVTQNSIQVRDETLIDLHNYYETTIMGS